MQQWKHEWILSTLPHSGSVTQSLVPSIQILMVTIITTTECNHDLKKVSQSTTKLKCQSSIILTNVGLATVTHVHD